MDELWTSPVPPPKYSADELRSQAKLRKAVHHLSLSLIYDDVTPELLQESGRTLNRDHYWSVVEERWLNKRCGYPLCSNTIQEQPCFNKSKSKRKSIYRICTTSNSVYTTEKLNKFCSGDCFSASEYFLKQLYDGPITLGDPTLVNPKLLIEKPSRRSTKGEEIISRRLLSKRKLSQQAAGQNDSNSDDSRTDDSCTFASEDDARRIVTTVSMKTEMHESSGIISKDHQSPCATDDPDSPTCACRDEKLEEVVDRTSSNNQLVPGWRYCASEDDKPSGIIDANTASNEDVVVENVIRQSDAVSDIGERLRNIDLKSERIVLVADVMREWFQADEDEHQLDVAVFDSNDDDHGDVYTKQIERFYSMSISNKPKTQPGTSDAQSTRLHFVYDKIMGCLVDAIGYEYLKMYVIPERIKSMLRELHLTSKNVSLNPNDWKICAHTLLKILMSRKEVDAEGLSNVVTFEQEIIDIANKLA